MLLHAHDLKSLRLSKGLRQDDIRNRKDVVDVDKWRKITGQRLIRRMANALNVPTDLVFAACQESLRRSADTAVSVINTSQTT